MAVIDASPAGSRELGLAAVAHLSRYRGTSREHTESDLRIFFTWCQDRQLAPLDAQRNDLELYLRWMQDVRRFKPSTVSRRLSVVAGFYRTCVIDGVLEHSPADYVRRPTVPPESPTLGLTHLQFEAMLTAAQSGSPFDFALVYLLGLLGLRIFETVGADIDDLGEEHGHRVLRVRGKGGKVVLVPLPPAVSRAVDRAAGDRTTGALLLNRRGARMDRHAATRRLHHLAADAGVRLPRMHPHMLRDTFVTTMLDAGVDLRDVQIAARHADPRTTMRYDRARKNLDRHPNYILAAYMAPDTTALSERPPRSSGNHGEHRHGALGNLDLALAPRPFSSYDMYVSEEQIQQWADEAEAGYNVDDLKRRGRGRPGRGAEPMQVVAVRLTAEELDALDVAAAKKDMSRSEMIRAALAHLPA